MSQPALTIASLLSDPRLERACRSWLKGGRYRLEDLGSLPDPVQELIQRRDTFDVVLLQQGSILPQVYEELRNQGLVLPAVVVGEVSGRVDYHEAEVHLPQTERDELLRSLERSYRDLLISYFKDPAAANQAIESFVHSAFFSDLPINKVVEIHVDLIDVFWKQLKLEGHKNDFLQDYRLALLDVMAHLCEMYRRSVPPDVPLRVAPDAVASDSDDTSQLPSQEVI